MKKFTYKGFKVIHDLHTNQGLGTYTSVKISKGKKYVNIISNPASPKDIKRYINKNAKNMWKVSK